MDYNTREKRYKYKQQRKLKLVCFLAVLGVIAFCVWSAVHFAVNSKASQSVYAEIPEETDIQGISFDQVYIYNGDKIYADDVDIPEWIDAQIIDIDGESRRGELLEGVNDIVIHYVGNPGTTAQQNRNFYNNPDSEVSSHFIVGLEGEIIQCVPLNEKSSASNWRNKDTISIEVCHPDDTGKFNDSTYDSLVKLTAWLLDTYNLDEEHIIRHYDITGKECPLYYVRHEDKWLQFKSDVVQSSNSQ